MKIQRPKEDPLFCFGPTYLLLDEADLEFYKEKALEAVNSEYWAGIRELQGYKIPYFVTSYERFSAITHTRNFQHNIIPLDGILTAFEPYYFGLEAWQEKSVD